jgi:hypothetical protein
MLTVQRRRLSLYRQTLTWMMTASLRTPGASLLRGHPRMTLLAMARMSSMWGLGRQVSMNPLFVILARNGPLIVWQFIVLLLWLLLFAVAAVDFIS